MLNRLRDWWESLGRNNQIVLVASSLGGMVALIGFVAWASTPEYVPLFSNLGAADATAITQKLKEHNVPYKLNGNGTSIEVPAQNHDEMLMTLVGEGLPQQANATPGWEILDKTNSFSTQPMEALMMMRAKEGEIAKSIMTLQQINNAIVHFANADDTPFTRDKHDASASIILAVKPGQSLSDENVHAIVRLTQMSFTGLNEKSISVVDGQGDLLFDGTRASSATGDEQMKRQHSIAQLRRSELQSLLDTTIGPHKAVVLVNVELSSDSEATEKTDYQPGAVTSQQSDTEVLNGPGAVGGNAPGLAANVAGVPNPAGGGAAPTIPTYAKTSATDGKYTHDTVVKNSVPSVIKTNITKNPGRIEKLTVSALVDTKVPAGEVASITEVLKTAIGVDAADVNRTRNVTVAQVPFDRSAEEAESKASAAARATESTARLVSIFVPLGLMMLCLFLLARALRKPKMVLAGGQLALEGGGGGGMSYALDSSGNMMYGSDGLPLEDLPTGGDFTMFDENGQPIGLSTSTGPKTFDVINENFDSNLESILHMTKSKPETVALLIKSWISEDS